MAIPPVNSNPGGSNVSLVQPQQQTQVERAAEIENKKNSDHAKKAAAASTQPQAQPQSTVNTNGQTVGAIINVKA